jgi:hypothetical protein
MTSPTKQPPYQPHKTQPLSLTSQKRYHANVNENRPSGQKEPIYEQKEPM